MKLSDNPVIVTENITTGNNGEAKAAAFLREQNFIILRRNYRTPPGGEIDIIARNNDYLIFVEVKSRSGNSFGGPLYAVSPGQLKRIRRSAEYFLNEVELPELLCRFDLIALENDTLSWIQDIIR